MTEGGPIAEAAESRRQPSFEKRVLALQPWELYPRLFQRRQALATAQAQDYPQLEHEIEVLKARAKELAVDEDSPNLEDVREKQVTIGRKFAELDKAKNGDWFIREGLRVRIKSLEKRAEEIRKSGPTIKTVEHRGWQVEGEEFFGGRARPLPQWEQISPRLLQNSEANLSEQQEYNWYMSTLSEAKRREVRSLSQQMKPIGDNVRAVVCIPAYKEEKNIYRTLANYIGQTELKQEREKTARALNYGKLRIVVMDNWPAGTISDNTEAEVHRFIAEHPEVQVDYIKAQFNTGANPIGNIRNMLTAAVIENAAHRKQPKGELIYISNDGDMPDQAIRPDYVARIINEFDTHPQMDALAGKIDMPENLMAQVPVQLATRRLWDYQVLIQLHKQSRHPFLVGRNSALRLKMVAAVGNYDPVDGSGEDVEIGHKVEWARSWNGVTYNRAKIIKGRLSDPKSESCIRYVHSISMDTDPRRDLVRLLRNEPIIAQYWGNFPTQRGVRGTSGEDLVEQAVKAGLGRFDRARFEKEVSYFYEDAKRKHTLDTFKRAMSLLGAGWTVENGKFGLTDTRKLETGIRVLGLRELHQTQIESWLGIKIKGVHGVSIGENNQVYTIRTVDGRELIIRASTQQDRDKFTSEKAVLEQLAKAGVPVPKIVAIDTTRSIIPGHVISVSERLPGTAYARDYERKQPVDASLLQQVGAALRKAHGVQTAGGFGIIDEKCRGTFPNWEQFVLSPLHQDKLARLVTTGLSDQATLDLVIKLMGTRRHLLADTPRQLLHGDFTLGNILQENGRLTGLLDLENAKSGDPLWDIAHFMVYESARVGGENGLRALLTGYGKPDLLDNPQARERYNVYRLANILYGLEWYSYQPHKKADTAWLNKQLADTIRQLQPETAPHSPELMGLHPASRPEINKLLADRFNSVVTWFKGFYKKGVPDDQEFIIGERRYKAIQSTIETALKRKDAASRETLFSVLKSDPEIAKSGFSDQEIRRQIDRLITTYITNPRVFTEINTQNPAFKLLVFLRNRGKLERYTGEYTNLPKEINFMQVALGLAKAKAAKGETMNILDEGGTFDVALQQLTGAIKYHVPTANIKLASIAADSMASEFSDCHKFPVDHRMADVHHLNEVFGGEKRTLVVSQAAYKFFWDPVGAITESANALENGGWAFLGDIRDKTSYKIFEMFRDKDGQSINPQKFFAYLNTLNLGYKFYTGMHTSMRDGEPRQVMTLAIKKETDKNLSLPLQYFVRQDRKVEGKDWASPFIYIAPFNKADVG